MRRPSRFPQPLDTKQFYILLALSLEPMHGYAVHEQILTDTKGTFYFYPASLYRLLVELSKQGLVEVVRQERGLGGVGATRTVYRLTGQGRRMLKSEGVQWQDAGRLAARRVP
ncbi:MAG: transcriptional regulator, PadR-like family [Patescibacteria group bacterium]|nr:transcriptional regulator, PadR-like family [Patescibacteria group bacterium]